MTFIYSDPNSSPTAIPDVEVFRIADEDISNWADQMNIPEDETIGWYYWSRCPNCTPDTPPVGPYATEAEAIAAVHSVDQRWSQYRRNRSRRAFALQRLRQNK